MDLELCSQVGFERFFETNVVLTDPFWIKGAGKMFMRKIIKSARFGGLRNVSFALIIALGLIGVMPRIGVAGLIPTNEAAAASSLRIENIAKIQTALERKEIAARLSDYGLTPDEVSARLDKLSDQQVTELASQVDKINAGGDAGGLLITILVVILIVALILWLLKVSNKDLKKAKE